MGKLFAMSIVHGQPSPRFFTRSIVEYLLEEIEDVFVDICGVAEPPIRETLQKLETVTSQEEFQELISRQDFEFIMDCGLLANWSYVTGIG
uniref:HECT domain-containing protein n=1 Tax=Amphimedon queenslandica TaxID=400682 RepID=A0A1X7VAS6_AMPQE